MKALFARSFIALSLFVIGGQSQKTYPLEPSLDDNIIPISLLNCRAGEAITQRLIFAPTNNSVINITDVPSDMFLILQVHTYQYNVSLSYDEQHLNKVSNNSLFGSNIGLFVIPNKTEPTQVFLRNDNVRPVEALLAVVPYSKKAPIPGGCNMEFNIEVAPYQKLLVNDAIVTVDLQPASLPLTNNETERSCEKHPVHHNAYRVYLTEQDYSVEGYFNAIANMLTVENIIRNGEKIPPPVTFSPFRRIYSAYPGTGAVFAVIATYQSYSSAYVPTFTYGCNYLLYPEDCQLLNNTLSSILCGLILVAGCFCVFLGHKFQVAEAFAIKAVFSGAISYIMAKAFASYSVPTNMWISIGGSILFLIALSALSCYTSIDTSALVSVFSFGCLCSSVIYFAVTDSTGILENNWMFWSMYLAITLVILIVLSVIPCCALVVTGAFLGAFMVILPIDYFAGSSLKYIIINVIRRLTVSQFNYAVVSPPMQSKDVSLIVFWILLATLRITNEFCGNVVCFFCKRNHSWGIMNTNPDTMPLISHVGAWYENYQTTACDRRSGTRSLFQGTSERGNSGSACAMVAGNQRDSRWD
ncbi:hypothetical protein KPH14_005845 [Odynerus spinipes]|uniref:TM7S3/TM198-like domain-containing protein n=1 Tax=Odynerus spinipes TaxID=1348599 RepID=A0AAD9RB67_9HYME|nr:hypothetical protein KPH14_005845 [Odynerus spinipes]